MRRGPAPGRTASMPSQICIINAHPDPSPYRFAYALCDAYEKGALESGHSVSRITIGELPVSFLASAEDFETPPDEPILSEREKIAAADHLFIAFPLWIGGMPAKARAFLEQCARAHFFLGDSDAEDGSAWPKKLMKGKSARIAVTMGMPGFIYRTVMDAGALKAIERGLLGIAGVKPIRHTIMGVVDTVKPEQRGAWLLEMERLGGRAE